MVTTHNRRIRKVWARWHRYHGAGWSSRDREALVIEEWPAVEARLKWLCTQQLTRLNRYLSTLDHTTTH